MGAPRRFSPTDAANVGVCVGGTGPRAEQLRHSSFLVPELKGLACLPTQQVGKATAGRGAN